MSDTTYFHTARDLVDSKRILDALLRLLIKKGTVATGDLDAVLGATITKVMEAVRAEAITIFMVDKDARSLTFKYVYYSPALFGKDAEKQKLYAQRARQLESLALGWGQGIVGDTIRTGQASLVPDARKYPRFSSVIDDFTGFETKSVIAVPLKDGDEVVGCLEVINKRADGQTITEFRQRDVLLLTEVASYTARLLHRALHPEQSFTELEMGQFIARYYRLEWIDLDKVTLDLSLLQPIGEATLCQYGILPLCRTDQGIKAVLANPIDLQAISDFEAMTQLIIHQKAVGSRSQIEETIKRAFTRPTLDLRALEGEGEQTDRIIKLAHSIIENACKNQASDIHIEPMEDSTMVRYRLDGVCTKATELPKALHNPLVSRFKVMSQLDIGENRKPQDGRIGFKQFSPTYDLDLRVSTAPMKYGEKVCMRILDKTKAVLPLEKLGFSAYNLERYRKLIQAPYGMILHCGPTGSGKSLTLYSALNELNSPQVNICTVEDPVEYSLPGINQLQVNPSVDLTFASALRCFLRQDPDIILVGEIRDPETAGIAVEAAMTGHLVFATLHSNDAVATITRLVELRVLPYMVSGAVIGVCAQRLMRRLCSHCKQSASPTPEERPLIELAKGGLSVPAIYQPVGCPKCNQIGYKGRTGIHELMCVNEELHELIARNAPAQELEHAARDQGMRTLFEDAMEKVHAGVTSLAEALATVQPS